MPILLRLYKIGVLLPSTFDIALKPTDAINVHGAFPKKYISGAVGATLGNAPYSDRRAATQCLRHLTKSA
ncbi:MAG: hypothetical protein ACKN9A_17810 [Microcystis aeruginosa]